jgi:hypothetical protein
MIMDEPSMADRHRDEIAGIIAECEFVIAPHKAIAFWHNEGPKPIGHNPATVSSASRAIVAARAACSKAIAAACERHRAEANTIVV